MTRLQFEWVLELAALKAMIAQFWRGGATLLYDSSHQGMHGQYDWNPDTSLTGTAAAIMLPRPICAGRA
jgi:hypothetical protein